MQNNNLANASMKMNRILFYALFFATFFLCLGKSHTIESYNINPPRHILLITVCSIRADHLGYMGYPRNTSPNLDQLAIESMVYEQAITQWPKTAPAFAALFTGKYGHTTGVERITPHQTLQDKEQTLAELLLDQGYKTGAFSSTPAVNKEANFLQGFDDIQEPWRNYEGCEIFKNTTSLALEWISSQSALEEKTFQWVHYNNAHLPYTAPCSSNDRFFNDPYFKSNILLKRNDWNDKPIETDKDHPYRLQITRPDMEGIQPSAILHGLPDHLAYYIAAYDSGIFAADQMIGELLAGYKDLGIYEDSLIVMVGDHGEALGEHNYYFEHGRFPYDDCARVPMLIRYPGGKNHYLINQPVPTFSLTPTILNFIGSPIPPEIEAVSLLPGNRPSIPVFTESGYCVDYTLSIRNNRWKLIHVRSVIDRLLMSGQEYELYDLLSDPGELNNLYSTHPDIAKLLKEKLDHWISTWDLSEEKMGAETSELNDETLESLKGLGYFR